MADRQPNTSARPTIADHDYEKLVAKCATLPSAQGDYLVHDYVENLMLSVLDFQMQEITVHRAMAHYRDKARPTVSNFTQLKALLAQHPSDKEGNTQIAQYLWGYNHWKRVELLRRLVDYFEQRGVTTQEALKQWAEQADFERDFMGKVKGAGPAIYQWLVMRQGVETIKPDVWVHRFIQDTLGYSVSDRAAIQALERVARDLGVKAYELDWRIWEYQRRLA
jgi:hypothetical protein